MKLLVLLLVALFAAWLWRSRLARADSDAVRSAQRKRRAASRKIGAPQPIVACAACGLHLPASEALAGSQGRHYCSKSHLEQTERRTAPSSHAG